MLPDFFVDYKTVHQRIAGIKPQAYADSRNHLQGAVTHLSPFISHGVISTATVANTVLEHHSGRSSEKLLSELAWREYFHRVWQQNGEDIFRDLKHTQEKVSSTLLPTAIANANTGIDTIDSTIISLKENGYMHNHARLWLAALCCNISHTHWYQPARWLYYYLLDGDLASNCLSWQWVAGTFSHRKYIANQENINRFSEMTQTGTFLDISYEALGRVSIPELLQKRGDIEYTNVFPKATAKPILQSSDPVFLYSIWNLDPDWHRDCDGTRVLWIDPEMHCEFALSPLRWRFIQHWADAIDGLGIFVGSQKALFPSGTDHLDLYTREYPATAHWPGRRNERDWCYERPPGSITSFSNYWKKVRRASDYFMH